MAVDLDDPTGPLPQVPPTGWVPADAELPVVDADPPTFPVATDVAAEPTAAVIDLTDDPAPAEPFDQERFRTGGNPIIPPAPAVPEPPAAAPPPAADLFDQEEWRTGAIPPVRDEPAPPTVVVAREPEPVFDPERTDPELPVVAAAPAPPPPPLPPDHDDEPAATGPAPLSRAWRRGIAVVIAVGAVTVGIIAFRLASPSPTGTAGSGPAFTLPTRAVQPSTDPDLSISAPPGLNTIPSGSTSGAASATASKAPAGAPSVTVLNQTTVSGLAASEASRIQTAGWTVRRVTNIHAVEPQTTVFYDGTQKAAAEALMKAVPSIKSVQERPNWLLPTGGLIVVVAKDAA